MDGYIRVSRVGKRDVDSDSYITEDVQREKIETWAKLRGVEIVAWHLDRDQSGSKLNRPGFDACMDRIEAGATEGIVVAQIDRLSRADVADALLIVRKIHDEHGGLVAAVDLGIDPTTEVGEMLLTVLLALGRMQWRRYQASWAAARERAIKRGAHVGPTPLGYDKADDGTGLLVPSKAAPGVREAFKVAATAGLTSAVYSLAAAFPYRPWTTVTARRTLTNRVYLGEIRFGDNVNTKAHEPLVDLATWTAANEAATGVRSRRPVGTYALSQVALCESCDTGLNGNRMSTDLRSYRCRKNSLRSVQRGVEEECPAPVMVGAEALEDYVQAALLNYVANNRPDEDVVLVPGGDQADVERAEAELRSAIQRRDNDARNLELSPDVIQVRMEAHEEAIAEAEDALLAATEAARPAVTWPLVDEVATANVDDLPDLLERCGLVVRVAPGRGNLPERVTLTNGGT